MALIEILTETEENNRWTYHVRVGVGACDYDYQVTLSWSDYNLWSRGIVAPQKIVHAIFEFLLHHEPAEAILSNFDCALVRRYFPDVDTELPNYL